MAAAAEGENGRWKGDHARVRRGGPADDQYSTRQPSSRRESTVDQIGCVVSILAVVCFQARASPPHYSLNSCFEPSKRKIVRVNLCPRAGWSYRRLPSCLAVSVECWCWCFLFRVVFPPLKADSLVRHLLGISFWIHISHAIAPNVNKFDRITLCLAAGLKWTRFFFFQPTSSRLLTGKWIFWRKTKAEARACRERDRLCGVWRHFQFILRRKRDWNNMEIKVVVE